MLIIGFIQKKPTHFESLNVERINIVENDGTIKLIITNTSRFPTGQEKVNGRINNEDRKKRSGMLFFNEDGIEAGGFIFDGKKTDDGHSSGLSLTFDQYDGDQVMQLLTTDFQNGDERIVRSGLSFRDRPPHETQDLLRKISAELNQITDEKKREEKINEYIEKGYIGGAQRLLIGKTENKNNGLFLFAQDGSPRASFYVDQNDQVKLLIFNAKGEVESSWPAPSN